MLSLSWSLCYTISIGVLLRKSRLVVKLRFASMTRLKSNSEDGCEDIACFSVLLTSSWLDESGGM